MAQETSIIICFQTVHQNGYEQDPYAKEFGINISEKLTSVEARVLPAPWVRINLCHCYSIFPHWKHLTLLFMKLVAHY